MKSTTKLESQKALLEKEKMSLEKLLKKLNEDFDNSIFPFDFDGQEPKDDAIWIFIDFLVTKGYLTADILPTELSIQNDYFRYNNGSYIFQDLEKQPKLVCTGKFVELLSKEFPNPYKN